jgi:hypothetical protein
VIISGRRPLLRYVLIPSRSLILANHASRRGNSFKIDGAMRRKACTRLKRLNSGKEGLTWGHQDKVYNLCCMKTVYLVSDEITLAIFILLEQVFELLEGLWNSNIHALAEHGDLEDFTIEICQPLVA